MKNKFTLLFIAIMLAIPSFAQYEISSAEFDYYDEDRTRWIETHVYYPSVIDDGTTETFPFLVIGHGFSINFSKYAYIWEHFVPQGYIVILPNTETGTIGVEHDEFGYDLGFLAGYFYEQSLDAESEFYNNVEPYPAVMGHSMGGGATHLAAESYTDDIGLAISFAAAETDPSAIDACENADIPVYIFYGEVDAVSPPDENQILMYNNSNSACKTMINILGGGHCFFALSDWICELADSSPTSISREEQHDVVLDFLDMILDYELKGNQVSECNLVDSLENSPRIDYERSCMMMEYSIDASANPSAGGTITGAGDYEVCSSISLTATANSGYEFINWTEGGTEVSTDANYSFTVAENRTLIANFETSSTTEYTITATADPTDGGSITGAGLYAEDATCTLTATANSGYEFINWTEGGTEVSTDANYSFTVAENRTLIANFETSSTTEYTITATADPTDGGSITGAGVYTENATCTLIATANTDYEFDSWTEGGIEVSTDENYVFEVLDNRDLVAVFTETVTINDANKNTIQIYPNPAQDIIQIKNAPSESISAHIYTISGKLIQITPVKNTIDISQLSIGTYLIKLMNSKDVIIYQTRISKTK